MKPLTTFIIATIERPTLQRAIDSAYKNHHCRVDMEVDDNRQGESEMRNRIIERSETPWVSMLDDDDTVTPDYVECLQDEILEHPDADVIIFREYFLHGVILPAWPVVAPGNIPISFSVKRELALKYPFIEQPHEDLEFIKKLEAVGAHIVFSKYLTYRARH